MPTYAYEALNAAGKPQKGTVEAGSSEDAVQQIKQQGFFPTAVREQKVKGEAGTGPAGRVRKRKRGFEISLAIGRRGQNVRLASQLSGWSIDILTEAEESERRQEEFRQRSQMFIEMRDVDETIGVLVTLASHAHDAQLGPLRAAQLLLDLELDRQPVAVPAGLVGRAEPSHALVLRDDVLEDLVERVADVDVAVRVGRAVMEQELRGVAPVLEHALVQPLLLPAPKRLRLPLGQVGPHRELGSRQVQGVLVVHRSDE